MTLVSASLVSEFHRLFPGSELSHTVFRPNGRKSDSGKAQGEYSTLKQTTTLHDYEDHLTGRAALVLVPVNTAGRCRWALIDVDFENYQAEVVPEQVNELRKRVVLNSLPLWHFPSKSGGAHLIVFFEPDAPAAQVRALLKGWLKILDLPETTEIFPKQDFVGTGNIGSAVMLPCFGDPAGFETFLHYFKPFNVNAASAVELLAVRRSKAQLPKMKPGVNLREELEKAGLKCQKRVEPQGTSYDYHGIDEQPCLLQGTIHEEQRNNPRQCRFLETKSGELCHQCFDSDCRDMEGEGKTRMALRRLGIEHRVLGVSDGSDWREHCSNFFELSTTPPKHLVESLVPEKCLTIYTGPSFHGKTYLALATALSAVTGNSLLGHFSVPEPLPVLYHIPEMSESLFRQRLSEFQFGNLHDKERFLCRPMEKGAAWALTSPEMKRSSRGRLVFLDTMMYFNDATDAAAYSEVRQLAEGCFELLSSGCLGIVALYHPPKYAASERVITLENYVLGSAGYGGILGACLAFRCLDHETGHVYLQQLKARGKLLKPFQTEGAPPELKVAPGQSPYLEDLMKDQETRDPRYAAACQLFEQKLSQRNIAKQIKVSLGTVNKWRKRWLEEKEQSEMFDGA